MAFPLLDRPGDLPPDPPAPHDDDFPQFVDHGMARPREQFFERFLVRHDLQQVAGVQDRVPGGNQHFVVPDDGSHEIIAAVRGPHLLQ